MLEAEGVLVALFERPIDTQFATMLEQYMDGVKFLRVDSGVTDILKSGEEATSSDALEAIFKEIVGEDVKLSFEAFKDASVPAMLSISEESRRMEEMMRFYNMGADSFPKDTTLVLNSSSPLIAKLGATAESDVDTARSIASYVYKLTLLSQKKFSPEEMREFMSDSVELLMKI